MLKQLLSFLFKKKESATLHSISKPQKTKKMKKDVPNLPKSSMLQPPASSGKGMVKKAAAKKVAKATMGKAKKMKY